MCIRDSLVIEDGELRSGKAWSCNFLCCLTLGRQQKQKIQDHSFSATGVRLVSTKRKSSLPKVDRDEVLQSSLENVQPMLNLAVLDKDSTDGERKIAEVQLPLADSEGHTVTRKLDITFCGNFFTCKLG